MGASCLSNLNRTQRRGSSTETSLLGMRAVQDGQWLQRMRKTQYREIPSFHRTPTLCDHLWTFLSSATQEEMSECLFRRPRKSTRTWFPLLPCAQYTLSSRSVCTAHSHVSIAHTCSLHTTWMSVPTCFFFRSS